MPNVIRMMSRLEKLLKEILKCDDGWMGTLLNEIATHTLARIADAPHFDLW